MSILEVKKENVDSIKKIWLPDKTICEEADHYRHKEEWLRTRNGLNGTRPTKLGIERYTMGNQLHESFFSGQTPPPVALDSMENLEWYADQLHRCVYGYEYGNQRITGD